MYSISIRIFTQFLIRNNLQYIFQYINRCILSKIYRGRYIFFFNKSLGFTHVKYCINPECKYFKKMFYKF